MASWCVVSVRLIGRRGTIGSQHFGWLSHACGYSASVPEFALMTYLHCGQGDDQEMVMPVRNRMQLF